MWQEQATIPIENPDPFKSWIEGASGTLICSNGTAIPVTLKKDASNRSGLDGKDLRITTNVRRGGFEIFENNSDHPSFMSYEEFALRVTFLADRFLVELGPLTRTTCFADS